MTVCIAAVCEIAKGERMLVLCADGKGSSPLGSKEQMLKIRLIAPRWRCLTAGADDEVNAILPLFRKHVGGLNPIDETNIVPAVKAALQERKSQRADEHTQRKWGMSFAEFRRARSEFPEEEYRSDMFAIGQITLDLDCLLCGFLDDNLPMIIQANGTHGVSVCEDFAVAGSGSHLAQYGLLYREHYDSDSFKKTVCSVYEAKRYAERTPNVGKATFLLIVRPDEPACMLHPDGQAHLSNQFDMFGPKPIDEKSIELEDGFFRVLPPEMER